MDTITIGKGFSTIEDCEDAWNEQVAAGVTATADTDFIVGTRSAKIAVAGAAATGILVSEAVSTTKVGVGLWMWIKASVTLAAGDFQILLDDTAMCASPHETLNIPAVETANQWQRVYIAFASPAAGTSIISIGLKMIVDKTVDIYMDDILQSTTVVVDQTVLSISGVGHPEESESFASQETDLLDGTIYQNTQYIRRVPIVRTGVVSATDVQSLNDIWVSSDQEILYLLDGVKVARGEDRLLVEWADGFKQARMVTMKFRERRVWSGRPTRWAYNLS